MVAKAYRPRPELEDVGEDLDTLRTAIGPEKGVQASIREVARRSGLAFATVQRIDAGRRAGDRINVYDGPAPRRVPGVVNVPRSTYDRLTEWGYDATRTDPTPGFTAKHSAEIWTERAIGNLQAPRGSRGFQIIYRVTGSRKGYANTGWNLDPNETPLSAMAKANIPVGSVASIVFDSGRRP